MVKEFKEFLMKGNLVEIAVGLVLALAFTTVVNSLVNDIIGPIIAAVVGEPSFEDLTFAVRETQIRYGAFIEAVINFVIVGFVLFLVVKAYNKMVDMSRRGEEEEEEPEEQIALLREIRDALSRRG